MSLNHLGITVSYVTVQSGDEEDDDTWLLCCLDKVKEKLKALLDYKTISWALNVTEQHSIHHLKMETWNSP